MTVKYIPDGYHTVTPYLVIKGAKKLIEFLKQAFDAEEVFCMTNSDGSVKHAQVKIGDSQIMMGEAMADMPAMPAMFYLYVKDVDANYKKAIAAGAKSIREPANLFYGDRSGGVKDDFGNQWWIATHVEDVSEEEIRRRSETKA